MDITIEEYTEDVGKINWQEGFLKELEGLSIEEQLRCFAWTTYGYLTDVPYNQVESICREKRYSSEEVERVDSGTVLVKEGRIVAIRIKQPYVDKSHKVAYEDICIRPYESYCYANTSDNNGAGYKETNWYKYLICLPASHSLW